MADAIPNLWPADGFKVAVRSPLTILKAQAALAEQMSAGLLRGEVKAVKMDYKEGDKQQTALIFDLIAPTAGNLRRTIVIVWHDTDGAYPARFINPGGYDAATTEEDFVNTLQAALASDATTATVNSLLARANENNEEG